MVAVQSSYTEEAFLFVFYGLMRMLRIEVYCYICSRCSVEFNITNT